MRNYKDKMIIGLALFSMFFGAGNVVFPPYLGMQAGTAWIPTFICYYMADIGLALLAILAMLRCGSDIEGVTARIGKLLARLIGCVVVLCTGPLIAVPRTGATTYEMLIEPLAPMIPKTLSAFIFFGLILILCLKETSVIDIVGKFLTPALFIGLMAVIVMGIVHPLGEVETGPKVPQILAMGIYSGYQTMDVLGALLFGVLIFKTVEQKGYSQPAARAKVIRASSIIAGVGLLLVYGGLAYLGATVSSQYDGRSGRSQLVLDIILRLMGNSGSVLFGIVVALACMTTAIALVSASAEYFSRLSKGRIGYVPLVVGICLFSAVVSNLGLDAIVTIASPILNIVYAPSVVLILLTIFGDRIKKDTVFKGAAIGALLTSLIETAATFGLIPDITAAFPFSALGFAWIVPAAVCGVIGALLPERKG